MTNQLITEIQKHKKPLALYTLYIVAIVLLLLLGTFGNISASHVRKGQQFHAQNRPTLIRRVKRAKSYHHKSNWFNDGLSKHQLKARAWIVRHESGGYWNILSYGHRCIGLFQLDPAYLGYKHGHVNLNHKHQVKVADKYVALRYGNWTHAKRFWEAHHWY